MSEGQIDPKLFRDNPDAVAAYLSDAFAKNDLTALLEAINLVMRAQNVQAMAREAGCVGIASTKHLMARPTLCLEG